MSTNMDNPRHREIALSYGVIVFMDRLLFDQEDEIRFLNKLIEKNEALLAVSSDSGQDTKDHYNTGWRDFRLDTVIVLATILSDAGIPDTAIDQARTWYGSVVRDKDIPTLELLASRVDELRDFVSDRFLSDQLTSYGSHQDYGRGYNDGFVEVLRYLSDKDNNIRLTENSDGEIIHDKDAYDVTMANLATDESQGKHLDMLDSMLVIARNRASQLAVQRGDDPR